MPVPTVHTLMQVQIIYPINNTLIGNGTLKNVVLPSHATTTFTFPFSLDYTEAIDPNHAILEDLLTKCAGSQQDLTITYKLTVGVKVFFITVSPTISNPISFPCPIPQSTLQVSSLMNFTASFQLQTVFFDLGATEEAWSSVLSGLKGLL